MSASLSRRNLLRTAAAGAFLLGFRLAPPSRAAAAAHADGATFAPNAFVAFAYWVFRGKTTGQTGYGP